jgi:AraC family transcriptional regulator
VENAMRDGYHERLRRVLEYIDRHIDGDLRLETLSGVAALSKYHFHHQFTASVGVALHRYIQLVRMKRASYRLAFRDGDTVTDIAMDAGYEAPEAFARAFRQRFGQAPTAFRQSPDWASWRMALGPLARTRTDTMQSRFDIDQVRVIEVPAIPVACRMPRDGPEAA